MTEKAKPHISITQLNMIGRCPQQYCFRYELGLKIPPYVPMIIGGGWHVGVEGNMKYKLETGVLMPEEQVLDITRDALVQKWETEGASLAPQEQKEGWKKIQAGAVDVAIGLARVHYYGLAPTITPTYVERSWIVEIPGYPVDIAGRIDLQEDGLIIESKTTGKSPPAGDADNDEQLTMYAMASLVLDNEIPRLRKDYVVKTKTPKVADSQYTSRTQEDFEPILARVEMLVLCREKGIFPPITQSISCNPRGCGYTQKCKYYRRKR